jgi:5-deoxy-glucuronate isomerase
MMSHQMLRAPFPADGLILDGREALIHFQILRLERGQRVSMSVAGCELAAVVLSGTCDLEAGDARFPGVGRRPDVWSGPAETVYAPRGATLTVVGAAEGSEVAVVGGRTGETLSPFRVRPDDVETVEVGSLETHSRRRIVHLLGQRQVGRVGNLLVSELYADGGCWSGYPPHKHDTESPPEETDFAELYHYRFRPDSGFGAQLIYDRSGASQAYVTRSGDTFYFTGGYHPTVTSPGHDEYLLTVLVGRQGRSLIQNFQEEHRGLMAVIPGIDAMRRRFR